MTEQKQLVKQPGLVASNLAPPVPGGPWTTEKRRCKPCFTASVCRTFNAPAVTAKCPRPGTRGKVEGQRGWKEGERWGIWATVSHTFKRLEFSNARLESNLKTMWVVFMSKLFLNYQKMVILTSWCYPESVFPTTVTESVGRFPTSNDIFNLIASGQRSHIFLFLPDISGLQTCPQLQRNGHHFASTKQKPDPQQKWNSLEFPLKIPPVTHRIKSFLCSLVEATVFFCRSFLFVDS